MTEDAGRLRVASALEATGAYDGPLDLDLGNLAASDPSPIDPDVFGRKPSDVATAAALSRGRDVLQRLVGDLFTLPSEADVNGRYVELPAGTTYFPRTKPLPPQEKPMTKWEKFAKEKGIKKRKRSKLVYDEQTDEWKRRHGYDRVKDADRIIIADAKMSDVPGKTEDPFSKEERERRERVEKNAGKQVKNLQKAVASHGKHVLPPTLQMSAAPKKGVKALPLNGMKKQQIKDLTAQVAISTASMAKYNAPIPGQFIFIFGNFWQFLAIFWQFLAMVCTGNVTDVVFCSHRRREDQNQGQTPAVRLRHRHRHGTREGPGVHRSLSTTRGGLHGGRQHGGTEDSARQGGGEQKRQKTKTRGTFILIIV